METENSSKEQIILIDNELSATQKFLKSKRLRRCKVFCSVQKMIYITTFTGIVFLVYLLDVPSLLKNVGKVSYDTATPVFDDSVTVAPVTEETYAQETEETLKENVARLRGLVSFKKVFKMDFNKGVGFNLHLLI